jgi:undecaprenyl-diphosphatase
VRLAVRLAGARTRFRDHPLRAALARRFPKTYGVLERRLTPRRFTGLPLTLMAAAALYLASLLGGLVEELREAEELVAFDEAVDALVAPYRVPLLIEVFEWITDLGGSPALVALALVATGFLWADHRPRFIPALWVAFVGAHATTYLGKFAIGRARPEFVTDITALSPSFPSGHATGALAVYGFLAYAIIRDRPEPRVTFEITFWTLVLVACIGFSRVFLSVHYASDVAAGFLVGGFWLLVAFAVAEHLRQRKAAARAGPTAGAAGLTDRSTGEGEPAEGPRRV